MSNNFSEESSTFIKKICDGYEINNHINSEHFNNHHIKRGLRNQDGTGVVAGVTRIGNVRGYSIIDEDRVPIDGILTYRGINVYDIIDGISKDDRFGFEEVAYLLLMGKLPTSEELLEFNRILTYHRTLPHNFTEDMIIKAPSANIMNKLARSVLALYSFDEKPDDTSLENMVRQSLDIIARLPIIAAQAYQVKRHYYENKSMHLHVPPEELSSAESLLYCMRSDRTYTDEEAKLLDKCLILHAEHGGGNNSTFTTRVLSSSGTDTYSAIAASICSLKGPLHGGANKQVSDMLRDIEANVKNWKSDDEVSEYLAKIIRREVGDKSGKIYGMGHAIYTLSDPRAVMLKQHAKSLASKNGFLDRFELIESVERLTPDVFRTVKGSSKPLCANVDLYSGLVYEMLGIPQDLYTPIFAIARVAGLCAHRIEEAMTGGRIIRPGYKCVYQKSEYTPISEREL
ncbi:MAG: citrate synthase [Oscillospiraceae bacterium]|nr:citrate synthase [Oscillospiraceae bacterium]